ncbi:high mobility group B protein 7-like [Hibiscus syriacus]|uniref:high mobility group B protein 7-like n=1 Tax=Hibiscus syriacus TaxID=106335 RepID=UPI0019215E2C|nr:high mobility group B protein 7-like [Hibiscus syriacus]
MKKAVAPNNPISLYSSSPQIPPSCSIRLVVFSAQRKIAGGSKSNPPKPRKRVDAASTASLVRARDGSAFAKCDECNKTVPVTLINMHSCSLEAKIKMNLEAQVIEKPAEANKKPAERKKPSTTEPNAKKPKKLRRGKGPNAPKHPPTAFFLFMDDFRKSYKEANPDAKGVTGVAKEGGEKWRSMYDEEKKCYIDKAAELKAEYEKAKKEEVRHHYLFLQTFDLAACGPWFFRYSFVVTNISLGCFNQEEEASSDKEAPAAAAQKEAEVSDDY